MNAVLIIMSFFCILGLIDDFIGGKMGVAEDFQSGLTAMGRMCLCYSGFYCVGITLVEKASGAIGTLAEVLPFDPSLIIGCLVSSDCGGLPIAMAMAATPALGIFTGALVGSGLGCSMGYQFPYYLSSLNKQLIPMYMQGAAFGLVTVPVGLLAGGLMIGLELPQLIANILPVAVLCLVMIIGFLMNMEATLKVLLIITRGILLLTYVLFGAVVLSLFLPGLNICDFSLVQEICAVVLRTVVVTCGGLVMARLIIRFCHMPVAILGRLLKINDEAVMGLFLSLFNGLAMLPLLTKMDKRGQIMNVAFSVCGAFCLGGQMAFVSAMVDAAAMPAYMVSKLLSGVCAMLVASRFAIYYKEEAK